MPHRAFGGPWTEEKLRALEGYLRAYLQIFTRNEQARHLRRHYVDAFAGSGLRQQQADEQEPTFLEEIDEALQYVSGSAKRVLALDEPFHEYWFVEQSDEAASELQMMIDEEFPHRASQCHISRENANDFMRAWCAGMGHLDRAVVFLDPFDMSVTWDTVECIARTEKIDLWMLFPVMATMRLLPNAGPREQWRDRLTQTFGTDQWEEYFYRQATTDDMFDSGARSDRDVSPERIARFMVERLGEIFVKVTPNPLILRNHRGFALFMFVFAASNPRAADTAVKIASYITEHGGRH